MVFCRNRNRLGRGLWFEQLPQPFTGRIGVCALSLWELLCPMLLLVFGFSMVSLALISELSDAEGVTHLRHPGAPGTLQLLNRGRVITAKIFSMETQNSHVRFMLCVGAGLGCQLRSGAAPACVSCCWGMLFPPLSCPAGWGRRWEWPALSPATGCDLLMETQAEQRRKWLLKQAVNVEAAPSTCLHNYWNNKALSTAGSDGWCS